MTYQEFEKNCWPSLKEELVKLEPIRKQEKKAITLGIISSFSFLGVFLFAILRFESISWEEVINLMTLVLLGVSFLLGVIIYFILRPRNYKKIYKEKIISNLLSYTKYKWQHTLFKPIPKTEHADIKKAFYDAGLYSLKKQFNSSYFFSIDDVFYSLVSKILMVEVYVLKYDTSTDKKNKNNRVIFNGLFFKFDIPHKFRGETYIRSESREIKQPVGNNLTPKNILRETDLEWNDFEKSLSVQTTDEIEAREILTTDFMEIIYDWWHSHKKAVRLAFKNNHLYLSLPVSGSSFEPEVFSHPEKHKKKIWELLDSILLVEKLFSQIEKKYRV